jgi:DNA-binding response OmpR family regulator
MNAIVAPKYPDPETEPTARRGVILHVEDDDDTRVATKLLLGSAGFDVRSVARPDAAFAQAAACRDDLDVLVVDYHLRAEKNGTEVAETIARMLGHGMPIVILTGDPINAEVPWLKDSPVWLARKPMDPDKLVAGLAALVDFRRAMKKLDQRQVAARRSP